MIRAYHFVGDTLRDGRPIPADGEWLEHDGSVVICESGLHASRRPWHALQYAPGGTLCLVECDGDIAEQDDKLVARRRRIVRRIDAAALMRQFARDEASSVLRLWDAPPIVRQYLATGDESIRAAAGAAAWEAARAAAKHAAGAAAWDAAGDAAWDAAGAAARNRFDAAVFAAMAEGAR